MGEELPQGITRELLQERISLLRPGVVLYHEVPGFNLTSVRIMVGLVRELTADMQRFDLVLDLTEATRPNPGTMDEIRRLINEDEKLRRILFVTGKNPMRRIGLKFINAAIRGKAISLVTTLEDAERELDGAQD